MGVIGKKDTTYDLRGVTNSWDYENNNSASIELLQNCKVFCGTTSGTSMLAANCRVPTLLLVASNDLYGYNLYNKDAIVRPLEDFWSYSWKHPEIVYDALMKYYKEVVG